MIEDKPTLAQIPYTILQKAFPGLTDTEAQEMIHAGKLIRFASGTVICREGAVEDSFYIISQGQVEVTKVINESETRLLKKLSPGDFFGEMAIIHEAPRAATVTATQETTALEIQKASFTRLLEKSSSISVAMVREVSRRLRENDEMAIDDLRSKARELAHAYKQLADLEEARSQFLSNIAHELRTPLMAANGFLQLVQSGKLQGEALQSSLSTVQKHLHEITLLVNDILFMQEMDLILPEFKPTDIGAVTASAVENQRSRAEQNAVGLTLSLPPGLPKIPADPVSLERAISAILNNAIKFSPDGGEVKVTVQFDNTHIRIQIKDQGLGISPENLPHIFDRFFHIDPNDNQVFRGIGLGLSIAQQVIHQHNGSIQVQSQVGQGSTFTIVLKISPL